MRRVWFWAPCWYWYGWRTLLPLFFGGDEYGGGLAEHGIQLTVASAENQWRPLAVVRIPQPNARELGELIAVSRRLVWHDPRNADDPFWNPQEAR